MAIDTNQIKKLLGTGLSNDVVASAVGCTPAYISQLMSEESFSEEVIAMRSQALTAHNTRDLTIDGLEDKLLKRLDYMVDMVTKPMEAIRMFSVINAAKRRGVPVNHAVTNRTEVVVLSLPQVVKKQYSLSATNEIVDVGDQTLVTMTSAELLKKVGTSEFGPRKIADQQAYRKLAASMNKEEVQDVDYQDL